MFWAKFILMLAVVWKKIETKNYACTYAVQNFACNSILQVTFKSPVLLYSGQQISIEIVGLTNNGVLVQMNSPAQSTAESAAESTAESAAESAAQYTFERQAKKPKIRPHFT